MNREQLKIESVSKVSQRQIAVGLEEFIPQDLRSEESIHISIDSMYTPPLFTVL